MTNIVQCAYCKNYDLDLWGTGNCRAFPDGIPMNIIVNRHNHNLPYPGDHGILFEPEDENAAQLWAMKELEPAQT